MECQRSVFPGRSIELRFSANTFILQVCIVLHVHSESVNMVISIRQILLPCCEVYDYWGTIGQVSDDNPHKVFVLSCDCVPQL